MKTQLVCLKKVLLLVILFTSIVSCGGDDDVEYVYDNDQIIPLCGLYRAVSCTSDTAVDLNEDGIATYDLLAELSDYFSTLLGFDAQIKQRIEYDSITDIVGHFVYSFQLCLPQPVLAANGTELEVYYFNGESPVDVSYNITLSKLEFTYTGSEFLALSQSKKPVITSITVLPDNKIEAHATEKFYIKATNSWVTLNSVNILRKM